LKKPLIQTFIYEQFQAANPVKALLGNLFLTIADTHAEGTTFSGGTYLSRGT